jgi:hypothetical protein
MQKSEDNSEIDIKVMERTRLISVELMNLWVSQKMGSFLIS